MGSGVIPQISRNMRKKWTTEGKVFLCLSAEDQPTKINLIPEMSYPILYRKVELLCYYSIQKSTSITSVTQNGSYNHCYYCKTNNIALLQTA